MLKKVFLVLLVAFFVIQFIHPKKNKVEGTQANTLEPLIPYPMM